MADAEAEVDIENDQSDAESENGVDHLLPSIVLGKLSVPNNAQGSAVIGKDLLNNISKKIAMFRAQYAKLTRLGKTFVCYSQDCAASGNKPSGNNVLTPTCYSPLCLQKARVRKELLILLRKANSHTTNNLANSVSTANETTKSSAAVSGGDEGIETMYSS